MVSLAGGVVGVDGDVEKKFVQDSSANHVKDTRDLGQVGHLHLRAHIQALDKQSASDKTDTIRKGS